MSTSKSSVYINRWPRAMARLLDLCLWLGLLVFGWVSLQLPQSFDLSQPLTWLLIFMALPIALVLDALVAGLFGNTPVKAVTGIRVATRRGERLDFGTQIRRNYGVWTEGLGIGILPWSLYVMYKQYRRVSGRRETDYDERLHLRVYSNNHVMLRLSALLLAMACAVFMFVRSMP